MTFSEKIKETSLYIATCGGLNKYPGGGLLASLLAIPLVLFGRGIDLIFNWGFYVNFIIFLAFVLSIIYLSYMAPSLEYQVHGEDGAKPKIFIDKVLGLSIVFWGIPFASWKVVLGGFVLFHLFHFIKPLLSKYEYLDKLDLLPSVLGVVATDIVFGFIANIILRVIVMF